MIKVCCLKNVRERPIVGLGTKFSHSLTHLTHLFPLLISFYLKINVNMKCLSLANQISTKRAQRLASAIDRFFYLYIG